MAGSTSRAQIEMTGLVGAFHQHHQQPVATAHQAYGLKRWLWPCWPGNQAHQAGEIGEATGQLPHQVIESCPAQTEVCQFPFQVLCGLGTLPAEV